MYEMEYRAVERFLSELRNGSRVMQTKPLLEGILFCAEKGADPLMIAEMVEVVVNFPAEHFVAWDYSSACTILMWDALRTLQKHMREIANETSESDLRHYRT